MKPIRSFQSYRDFLDATFQHTRKSQPKLSLEKYSQKLGLGASNFKMILLGTRNLTSHHCLKIARALRMSPQETEYFEALVLYEQSETSWERAYYSRRFKRLKKELKTSNVRVTNKSFLSDAIIPALMVYLSDTMDSGTTIQDLDHQKLATLFKVSPEKMRETLVKLDREGLVKMNEGGKLHFVFDKLTNVLSQKAYFKNLMNEAATRIESEYEKSESYFTTFTFSTSDENLQGLKSDLQQPMEKHMSLIDARAPLARIAQANFQVFPVSDAPTIKK